MRRWIALAVSMALVAVAILAWRTDRAGARLSAAPGFSLPTPPAEGLLVPDRIDEYPADALPTAPAAPQATPRSREQRRFARYDKDRNAAITRPEYLAARRKAFAKLDANADGRLSFEEYATRTIERFDGADRDRSGQLNAREFATTRIERKAKPGCPPAPARDEADA